MSTKGDSDVTEGRGRAEEPGNKVWV
jgi:hypothetical protein